MRFALIGASKEAMALARKLYELGHEVVVLDNRRTRVDELRSKTDIAIYLGDLRNVDIYDEARVHRADVVVAAHDEDEANILACTLARYKGVPRIIALVNLESTARLLKELQLAHTVIVRTEVLADALLNALLGMKSIEVDGGKRIAVIKVDEHPALIETKLGDLKKLGIEVLAVLDENGNVLKLSDNDVIRSGYRIVVYGDLQTISNALRIGI